MENITEKYNNITRYYISDKGILEKVNVSYMHLEENGKIVTKDYIDLEHISKDIYSFAQITCNPIKLNNYDSYTQDKNEMNYGIKFGLFRLSRDKKGNIIPFKEEVIVPCVYNRISPNNLDTVTAYTDSGLTYVDIDPNSKNFGKQLVPAVLDHATSFDTEYEGFAECSITEGLIKKVGYLPRNMIPRKSISVNDLIEENQLINLMEFQEKIDSVKKTIKKYEELTGKSFCKKIIIFDTFLKEKILFYRRGVLIMRVYYLFKINDSFSKLYYNKTYYLYKILEQISNSSKNDFIISYRIFEQIAVAYNKTDVNSNIYRLFSCNKNYKKTLNKHILDDGVEKTKLTVYNTYIKIKTNQNLTSFFKVLKKEENVFVCDFNNKDYFWLNKVASKSLLKM